jgi:hypothetical protein
MASAVREAIRTPARMEPEKACDQHLEVGGRVVSPASERLCCLNRAQGALAWLSGFRAGFYGSTFVWPLGTLDPQIWAAGFIEGRGHRTRPGGS